MFRIIAIALFAASSAGCTATNMSTSPQASRAGCHGIGCLVDDPLLFENSNNYYMRGRHIYDSNDHYAGCHGAGCLVDDPSLYEDNPNFDEDGDYIGCHGIGCLVDDPEG